MEKKGKNGQPQIDLWKAFDPERARALCLHMRKKGLDLEQELLKTMEALYKRHVPKTLREWFDSTIETPAPAEENPAENRQESEWHD